MKIVILNGSPRPKGNTAGMIEIFKAAAGKQGHDIKVFDVCKMNIQGCKACEYCHGVGKGKCIIKDDMQEVYKDLKDMEMIIIASPIYYHGLSGQIKCAIDRFYSALYPKAPEPLKKVAMFLSSGDDDMYTGAKFSYDGDFVGYLGIEGMGIITNHDNDYEEKIRELAHNIQ